MRHEHSVADYMAAYVVLVAMFFIICYLGILGLNNDMENFMMDDVEDENNVNQ